MLQKKILKKLKKLNLILAKKDNDKKAEAQKISEQINKKEYLVKKLKY